MSLGGFGVDFSSDLESIETGMEVVCEKLLQYGVTSFCPTIVTSAKETYHQVQKLRCLKVTTASWFKWRVGCYFSLSFFQESKAAQETLMVQLFLASKYKVICFICDEFSLDYYLFWDFILDIYFIDYLSISYITWKLWSKVGKKTHTFKWIILLSVLKD